VNYHRCDLPTEGASLVKLNDAPTGKHPYPVTPQYYLAEMASPADSEVLVSQQDFEMALRELKPSVSETEMHHYAQVQRQFSEKLPVTV
jgi:peroxin-6